MQAPTRHHPDAKGDRVSYVLKARDVKVLGSTEDDVPHEQKFRRLGTSLLLNSSDPKSDDPFYDPCVPQSPLPEAPLSCADGSARDLEESSNSKDDNPCENATSSHASTKDRAAPMSSSANPVTANAARSRHAVVTFNPNIIKRFNTKERSVSQRATFIEQPGNTSAPVFTSRDESQPLSIPLNNNTTNHDGVGVGLSTHHRMKTSSKSYGTSPFAALPTSCIQVAAFASSSRAALSKTDS